MLKGREVVQVSNHGGLVVSHGRTKRQVQWSEIKKIVGWCWPFAFDEVFLNFRLDDETQFAIGESAPSFKEVVAAVRRRFALPDKWYFMAEAGPVVLWARP